MEVSMDKLEQIRKKISECDDRIVEALAVRMNHIQDIIQYKKENGLPILQPEQEQKQRDMLVNQLVNLIVSLIVSKLLSIIILNYIQFLMVREIV